MKIKDISEICGMSISEVEMMLMKNDTIVLNLNDKVCGGM